MIVERALKVIRLGPRQVKNFVTYVILINII